MGQAFVRFESEFDRDRMVIQSPHEYGGSHFTFVRHDQGRNWRSMVFNHECLLMLLGLPEDYWEDDCIDAVLGPYARVINWYKETTMEDERVLTRLLVKVGAVDLEDIPHFSVFAQSPRYNGHSWTVQIEIMQHENLGQEAPQEEVVPQPPNDGGPPLFDFFGLRQHVLAPVAEHDDLNQGQQEFQNGQHQAHDQGHQEGENLQHQEQQMPGWGDWVQNQNL